MTLYYWNCRISPRYIYEVQIKNLLNICVSIRFCVIILIWVMLKKLLIQSTTSSPNIDKSVYALKVRICCLCFLNFIFLVLKAALNADLITTGGFSTKRPLSTTVPFLFSLDWAHTTETIWHRVLIHCRMWGLNNGRPIRDALWFYGKIDGDYGLMTICYPSEQYGAFYFLYHSVALERTVTLMIKVHIVYECGYATSLLQKAY